MTATLDEAVKKFEEGLRARAHTRYDVDIAEAVNLFREALEALHKAQEAADADNGRRWCADLAEITRLREALEKQHAEVERLKARLDLERRRNATHRCKVCGALWREWAPGEALLGDSGSWMLVSPTCGKCCDNVAMGDQIEPVGLLAVAMAEAREPWGDPWCSHPRACSPTGRPEDCGWCAESRAGDEHDQEVHGLVEELEAEVRRLKEGRE